MTIAIGLIAKDGVVIASDTQISDSDWLKSNEGKLSMVICPGDFPDDKFKALGITGSGNAVYVRALRDRMSEAFSGEHTTLQETEKALQAALTEFYRDHVLPFDRYPANERPDIWLTMGLQLGNRGYLWSTEKNVLVEETQFAAVGIGATFAKMLLNKLYAEVDANTCALLAAYVIFQVKQTIDGCGHDTDIFVLTSGMPRFFDRHEIRALEERFREYSAVEMRSLLFTLGSLDHSDKAELMNELSDHRTGIKRTVLEARRSGRQSTTADQSLPQPSPESRGASGES